MLFEEKQENNISNNTSCINVPIHCTHKALLMNIMCYNLCNRTTDFCKKGLKINVKEKSREISARDLFVLKNDHKNVEGAGLN